VGLNLKLPFLSFRAKTPGFLLMLFGMLGIYLFNYQNYKPDWLQFEVFTVYSSFMSTKIFSFIKNNQGDEISTLLFFIGSFLIMASAEKNERRMHQHNRKRAMAWAAMISMAVFILEYLLLHGMAIVFAALLLPYLMPLFYLAGFYILNKLGDA
jgi:putative Mn2+ efflux pump MntP